MRVSPKIRRTVTTADVTLVTTTETVVATLGGVSNDATDKPVRLDGFAQVTGGTSTTAAALRIRRGTDATGTLVGEGNNLDLTGTGRIGLTVSGVDTPGEVGGITYVLTVQLVAASANGTVTQASLTALS